MGIAARQAGRQAHSFSLAENLPHSSVELTMVYGLHAVYYCCRHVTFNLRFRSNDRLILYPATAFKTILN